MFQIKSDRFFLKVIVQKRKSSSLRQSLGLEHVVNLLILNLFKLSVEFTYKSLIGYWVGVIGFVSTFILLFLMEPHLSFARHRLGEHSSYPVEEQKNFQGSKIEKYSKSAALTNLESNSDPSASPSATASNNLETKNYLYHIETLPTGGSLMEFSHPTTQKVFAIQWKTQVGPPDFADIFGIYYTEYEKAEKSTPTHPGNRRFRDLKTDIMVIHQEGTMGHFFGYAYVVELLPANFNLEEFIKASQLLQNNSEP